MVTHTKTRLLVLATIVLLSISYKHGAAGTAVGIVSVCDNAGAGGVEQFPDLCRLADGRLMCAFYEGYSHVSFANETYPKGGRVSFCTSSDEGRTWSGPGVLYDSPEDDRDFSITQLDDGRLFGTFFRLWKRGPLGYEADGAWGVTSADGGKTWSEPRLISDEYVCSSPVRKLSDGRLILGLYKEVWKDRRTPVSGTGAVATSDDGGKTWSDVVEIPNAGVHMSAETDVIELLNGRIFAAQRSEGMAYWSISSDGGKTWSTSKSFGFMAKSPYLHRTTGGAIVMAYRGSGREPTKLCYSLDECKTWSKEHMVEDLPGGYPSMVNLKDGSTLIAYYASGNIHVRRFRIDKSTGFEWLSP